MYAGEIECIQCGSIFDLSRIEKENYQQRGFDEPRRCPECRRRKRHEPSGLDPKSRRTKKKHYRMKYEYNE